MKKHQLKLPGWKWSRRMEFGGSRLKNNPKTKRELALRMPHHLILRSSQARGARSFLGAMREIEKILHGQADKCGVVLHDVANAGNHLHLLITMRSRVAYNRYIRSVSGLIVRKVLKVERGMARLATHPAASGVKKPLRSFWDARPYTRVVSLGRDFKNMHRCIMLNRVETSGIPRKSARFMLSEIERLGFAGLLAFG